jgi:hypothetical protein
MIESKLLSKKVIDTKGQETKTFLRWTCTCILEKNYI